MGLMRGPEDKATDDCWVSFLKRIEIVGRVWERYVCVEFFISYKQALLISINIPRDAVSHKERINCSM